MHFLILVSISPFWENDSNSYLKSAICIFPFWKRLFLFSIYHSPFLPFYFPKETCTFFSHYFSLLGILFLKTQGGLGKAWLKYFSTCKRNPSLQFDSQLLEKSGSSHHFCFNHSLKIREPTDCKPASGIGESRSCNDGADTHSRFASSLIFLLFPKLTEVHR